MLDEQGGRDATDDECSVTEEGPRWTVVFQEIGCKCIEMTACSPQSMMDDDDDTITQREDDQGFRKHNRNGREEIDMEDDDDIIITQQREDDQGLRKHRNGRKEIKTSKKKCIRRTVYM